VAAAVAQPSAEVCVVGTRHHHVDPVAEVGQAGAVPVAVGVVHQHNPVLRHARESLVDGGPVRDTGEVRASRGRTSPRRRPLSTASTSQSNAPRRSPAGTPGSPSRGSGHGHRPVPAAATTCPSGSRGPRASSRPAGRAALRRRRGRCAVAGRSMRARSRRRRPPAFARARSHRRHPMRRQRRPSRAFLVVPSFARTRATCFSTVRSDRNKVWAMSGLVAPRESSSATCCSRGDSSSP